MSNLTDRFMGEQDVSESREMVVITPGERALATEIDRQVATAKAYPRNLARSLKMARDMVTINPEVAGSCYYSLQRNDPNAPGGKKSIEGPSVKLAEIILGSWGNLRTQAMIVDETEKTVTARGVCWDTETNVAVSVDVVRNIWGKFGRFKQDMIAVTSQAAISLALRNAIFRVVPRVYVDQLVDQAREVAAGEAMSLGGRWGAACKAFSAMGVTPDELIAYLGLEGAEGITSQHIADLRGLHTGIKEGHVSVDEVRTQKDESRAGRIKDATKAKAAPAPPPSPEPKPAKTKKGETVSPAMPWRDWAVEAVRPIGGTAKEIDAATTAIGLPPDGWEEHEARLAVDWVRDRIGG